MDQNSGFVNNSLTFKLDTEESTSKSGTYSGKRINQITNDTYVVVVFFYLENLLSFIYCL